MTDIRIAAKPRPFSCTADKLALLVIDMQHDFLSEGVGSTR